MSLFRTSIIPAAAASLMAIAACGSDGANVTTLNMQFGGLETLGAGYVYEGWLIVDGAPVSTGRFNLDSDGNAVPSSFEVDSEMAAAATDFVLSIEPEVGDDPAPAPTKVLGGAITAGAASLSVDHPAALNTDFASAAGAFIVATPSSAAMDDDNLGIWWLDPTGPTATLTLPALPAGWAYEGWVVDSSGPVSTGRFQTGSGADDDGAGPTAGTQSSPPFPGQDFINPPRVVVGGTAVISVEPDPDDSAAPFALKPLIDMTIEDIAPPTTQAMVNQSASNNVVGSITLQ